MNTAVPEPTTSVFPPAARSPKSNTSWELGLMLNRYFSKADPYTTVTWVKRDAVIQDHKGNVIFEQKGIRVPEGWSQTALNIVASKYFHGKLDSPERESGVDQLIHRVVDTITASGRKQRYFTDVNAQIFRDELAYLLIHQMGAFNSPVWFNVGCEKYEPNAKASSWHWVDSPTDLGVRQESDGYHHPQCSACFINSVEDSMEGIMELAHTEAMLFKFGSGTGTNFSTLRSSLENVSGGGVASGPLSFMKGLDAFAGVIKSGGKTRRAAKMAILDVTHPDILDFIDCKLKEDKKAQALMAMGYDGSSGPDSEAYASVFYQNANNSVRVNDVFMAAVIADGTYTTKAVKNGADVKTYMARDVMRKIAEATWHCGDPGVQFDTTINAWHTSKATGRINSSNPCSEYMFLDDSACNLASLNLIKFLDADGSFQVDAFRAAVSTFIIAQDILVDMAGYPTRKIAINSHDFRPLGLGYANLGAMLMAKGLPYDSDAGRAYAATITSIMTGQAYATSAMLAKALAPLQGACEATFDLEPQPTGACPGFYKNRPSFLEVIQMHRQASATRVSDPCISPAMEDASYDVWNEAKKTGEAFGFRNAQVTVLAPTGTIGFMMDCDTTGIEPELALVKYKKLVGGGMLKIVNETVRRALTNLHYLPDVIEELIAYIDKNGTLEGAPKFHPSNLDVFDTAFRPANGTRVIHYMGHVKMMAATQPFLSGAISKTVNLSHDATVEDIEQAYIESWKLGLKSVAIYRDGSKSNQVLVTSKKTKSAPAAADDTVFEVSFADEGDLTAPPKSVRHRLPDTRPAVNHKFSIGGHDGYLNVGLYENGQPGEVFITVAKEGSTLSGLMDSFAVVFSIALQHGVPLEVLVSKLAHTSFDPSGWTGNEEMGFAKSIMDYLARWLELRFLKAQQGKLFAPKAALPAVELAAAEETGDAPPCPNCGNLTTRNGSCFKCSNCGSTTGCS
jgi:ribonucleoside-diphosphate reductase alpha chain